MIYVILSPPQPQHVPGRRQYRWVLRNIAGGGALRLNEQWSIHLPLFIHDDYALFGREVVVVNRYGKVGMET